MFSICMLSYQVYYELNKLLNVCLFPISGQSGHDVGNTMLQLASGSLVLLWNSDNVSNQKSSTVNS